MRLATLIGDEYQQRVLRTCGVLDKVTERLTSSPEVGEVTCYWPIMSREFLALAWPVIRPYSGADACHAIMVRITERKRGDRRTLDETFTLYALKRSESIPSHMFTAGHGVAMSPGRLEWLLGPVAEV